MAGLEGKRREVRNERNIKIGEREEKREEGR